MAMGSNPIGPTEVDRALLVELVDTAVSSAAASRYAGSSPAERRKKTGKMVQLRTRRKVVDNSGVREVRCIQVKRGKRSEGTVGHRVVASVTKVRPGSTWKRGDLVNGRRVMVKKERGRRGGRWVRQEANARVLLNKKGEPLGTRVTGVVPMELRRSGYGKIVSMSEYIV
jgi:large subunit ribosomal protein L14